MAGITDNESDVVITGEIDSSNDLVAGRDIHGVVQHGSSREAAGAGTWG